MTDSGMCEMQNLWTRVLTTFIPNLWDIKHPEPISRPVVGFQYLVSVFSFQICESSSCAFLKAFDKHSLTDAAGCIMPDIRPLGATSDSVSRKSGVEPPTFQLRDNLLYHHSQWWKSLTWDPSYKV